MFKWITDTLFNISIALIVLGFGSLIVGGLLLIGLSFIDPKTMLMLPEIFHDLGWVDAAAISFCSGLLFKGLGLPSGSTKNKTTVLKMELPRDTVDK